ncbi:hypothetical protein LINPERPRIM_LOCUS35488 [Linum perenne]
MPAEGS